MSMGLDSFYPSYVYRVLRPNEDPNSDLTCCAPLSSRDISQHVATGLKDPSRYISTTSSRDKAVKWMETANEKSSWRYGNKRKIIVRIDVNYLKANYPEIANSAYDLTNELNRKIFLKTNKERNFSCAYNEVVFKDRIPCEAVSVEDINGKGFVNPGDLSRIRTTIPIQHNTLSVSTPNSLNPSHSEEYQDMLQKWLKHLKLLKIGNSNFSEKKEVTVAPKAQCINESVLERKYQLGNTTSDNSNYKSTQISDVTRSSGSNPFSIRKAENALIPPNVERTNESVFKKVTVGRAIPIIKSIKSPEIHASYQHNYPKAETEILSDLNTPVNERNVLRRTLPGFSTNLSLDSSYSPNCSNDKAKRAFVSEHFNEPAISKYQIRTTKTDLNNSNAVTHTKIRPLSGSYLPHRAAEQSENSPVKRTIPNYCTENPIHPSYTKSSYTDNRAENMKVQLVTQSDSSTSETYPLKTTMTEYSKFKSIQPPKILPSYGNTFSDAKAKITFASEKVNYITNAKKPKFGETLPSYSQYQYFQPQHISSASIADRSDLKAKIPEKPEIKQPVYVSFREKFISDVSSRVTKSPIHSSVYSSANRVSAVAPEVKILDRPRVSIHQLRGEIAGVSECKTIQSPEIRPSSMSYFTQRFIQRENN